MQITAVQNGAEAIDALRRGTPYEVVVLDMMMPLVDGSGVLEFMNSYGLTTPVILMSGGGSRVLQQAAHAIVKRRLSKPFDVEDLIEAVRDLTL